MTTSQNEQQWLAALQLDIQRIYDQVNRIVPQRPPQGYVVSLAQITAAITFIDNGINFLRDTYTAAANSLRESGSPDLYTLLQRALHDMQDGKNTYKSIIRPRGRTKILAKIDHRAMKPLLMPICMISKKRATKKRNASNSI